MVHRALSQGGWGGAQVQVSICNLGNLCNMLMYTSCSTLFGKDDCSPSMGLSSTGKTCLTACAIDDTRQGHSGHYMCPVDDAGNMETCGHFSFDSSKKKAVEFTADHQVGTGKGAVDCQL